VKLGPSFNLNLSCLTIILTLTSNKGRACPVKLLFVILCYQLHDVEVRWSRAAYVAINTNQTFYFNYNYNGSLNTAHLVS